MLLNEIIMLALMFTGTIIIGVGLSFLCYWFYKKFGGELIAILKQ